MEDKPGRGDHLKGHQYQPGQSGNIKGKPKGRISKKTILRHVLDLKLKKDHELVQELVNQYPLMFTGKQSAYHIEELLTLVHIGRALTSKKADHVRIDILNRIHGKPIQAIMNMDHTSDPETTMTTDQTKEALARIKAMNDSFESSKKYRPEPDGPEPDPKE